MKRRIAIAIALALQCTCLWAQYDPSHFYYAGRQALSDGKYSLAIENFNILSRLDTVGPEAFFFRGIAKYNLGDLNGAERDFDASLKRNPLYTYAYHYRAITRSRLGRYEEALEDLQEAVDLRPGNTGIYFSRGVTYFLSQQFDKAVEDFNSFIRKEPEESSAYLNRGASYLFLGDTTKAFADYNKAIELNNQDPEGFVRRSRIFALQERYDDAISDLNRAIALDTTNTYAYFNRAILKYEKKEWTSAIADLNAVLKEEPGNALTLYNRALIYAQVGETDKAVDDLDRVININPDNVLAYFNRAAMFIEQGKYAQAIRDYDRAIELYPDFAKAYMNRSYAKSMLGQLSDSRRDWETAQKKVREYQAKTSTTDGYEAFADTTRKFDSLLALDADFAKKNFNNELLQYRDVDIKLKPMYQFVPRENSDASERISTIKGKLLYDKLDNFMAALPVATQFISARSAAKDDAAKRLEPFSEQIRHGKGTQHARFAKALLETQASRFNNAMESYSVAIDMDESNPFLYINRGVLQAEMTDFISSMENSVQTLTMDNTGNTTKTVVKDRAGTTYDYSAAIDDMLHAASLAADFPYVYYNLGNLYCLSDDLPAAVVNYTRALELFPYIGEAYYNRGLVQIFLKDKEKGCIDISKAGELGIADAYSVIKKYCSEEPRQ
ncbi:MAG: tetratricopeptide repeat protein [Bacteroidales bacterium]|nr:tetratricopeptide repeat protein [Bacteroidales bacterium]